ncbi:NifB/NifX family molybdenum-iron cluster-binding protein [Megasphaera cerevisiae]|uniref:NifB/NifX family molybdenum-iron cluster-binding protein n=1 Tax=Megasphaera cerevisiae TaxID=39029 RepID=UPI000945B41E|nr:NifB/NifX family molybdenum-iron cluster-binding protein [Megasphaera cerevisiae]OKY53697.1 dinitrogenase iron-molybdenum cofactor biosynthesis protein [Megasphaera cerevisiae]
MKIAVTYDDENVFQHFGHTEQFKFYDVENGVITQEEIVDTGDSGHGALAVLLQQYHVQTLICGGIGGGAKLALEEAGIALYGGVCGNADEAVRAFLAGTLCYDKNVHCDHHDHDDHEHDGESCGTHRCIH